MKLFKKAHCPRRTSGQPNLFNKSLKSVPKSGHINNNNLKTINNFTRTVSCFSTNKKINVHTTQLQQRASMLRQTQFAMIPKSSSFSAAKIPKMNNNLMSYQKRFAYTGFSSPNLGKTIDPSKESITAFPKEAAKYRVELETHETKKNYNYFYIGAGYAGLANIGKNVVTDVVDVLNPAADVLALANTEVNLAEIPEGKSVTVKWRGKPLFIRHRTSSEIEKAESTGLDELKDPQEDSARHKPGKAQWIVLLGICTHLGCVPLNNAGDYNGWFCPCHGSHYDLSGRIRKGPAPLNLEIPPYSFVDENLLIGVDN